MNDGTPGDGVDTCGPCDCDDCMPSEFEPVEMYADNSDMESELDQLRLDLTRAGINLNNQKAYIAAVRSEIDEAKQNLLDGEVELREQQEMFDAALLALVNFVRP